MRPPLLVVGPGGAGALGPVRGGVVGAGAGPGPDPGPPLDSLAARWRFGRLASLFQDDEGTIPVTADSDPVGRVMDEVGGHDLVQVTNVNRPSYVTNLGPGGALGGVHLVASTALDSIDTLASGLVTTTYLIGKISSEAVFLSRSGGSTGTSIATEYAYYAPSPASDALKVNRGIQTTIAGVSGQFPTGAYGVFCFEVDASDAGAGDTAASYLDGVLKASLTGNLGGADLTAYLSVNTYQRGGTAYSGNVDVLEVLVYHAAHGPTERAAVQAYAAAAYGTPP